MSKPIKTLEWHYPMIQYLKTTKPDIPAILFSKSASSSASYKTNDKILVKTGTSPSFFQPFLKVLKIAEFWPVDFILPEKHYSEVFFPLGWSSFLRNNVSKTGTSRGKTIFLHKMMQYLKNEANFSRTIMGQCLTYLNKTACKIWGIYDKVHY